MMLPLLGGNGFSVCAQRVNSEATRDIEYSEILPEGEETAFRAFSCLFEGLCLIIFVVIHAYMIRI